MQNSSRESVFSLEFFRGNICKKHVSSKGGVRILNGIAHYKSIITPIHAGSVLKSNISTGNNLKRNQVNN